MNHHIDNEKGLSLQPQQIDKNNWYYEERSGITVVHEVRDGDGNYIQTDQFKIPWKKLIKSCERKSLKHHE